jgi:hypothetical protein
MVACRTLALNLNTIGFKEWIKNLEETFAKII